MAAVVAIAASVPCVGAPPDKNRWEDAIAKMLDGDRESPPPQAGIVFVGSSSIRMWKLGQSFPEMPVINRGFGGSQVADSVYFADRIILPYQPQIVVVYAGDNDIAAGKSPAHVFADYQRLVKVIHANLPETQIVFIAIKPSLARWKLCEQMAKANALIEDFNRNSEQLTFVDIAAPMLGEDGKPRKALFREDGLHLSEAGYKLWTKLLRPHLQASSSTSNATTD